MTAEVIRIEDATTRASAEILLSQGFNCFSWKVPAKEEATGFREMLWAHENYASGEERASGSGIPLLFPFPGRIEKGFFTFEGEALQLADTSANGNAIHGYALDNPWRVFDQQADRVTAHFQPSVDAPSVLGQWTGDYLLKATYRIEGNQLHFDFEAYNLGAESLPFGFGTHAYFRLPISGQGASEQTLVTAPIDGEWLSNEMIPTGECAKLATDHPLVAGSALSGANYDTPFRIPPGESELLTTTLKDPTTGRRLVQTFDRSMTCCVVYLPPHREAICLEPYTCVPNPFGMNEKGVDSGLRVLPPGESYHTKALYEVI